MTAAASAPLTSAAVQSADSRGSPSGTQSATVAVAVLPGVPASARAARAIVRQACQQVGVGAREAGDAALCVSELTANAICHTRSGLPGGLIAVSVQVTAADVAIAVTDQGAPAGAARFPAAAGTLPAPGAEGGRGLALVEAITAGWGSDPVPGGPGRVTWFRVSRRDGEIPGRPGGDSVHDGARDARHDGAGDARAARRDGAGDVSRDACAARRDGARDGPRDADRDGGRIWNPMPPATAPPPPSPAQHARSRRTAAKHAAGTACQPPAGDSGRRHPQHDLSG